MGHHQQLRVEGLRGPAPPVEDDDREPSAPRHRTVDVRQHREAIARIADLLHDEPAIRRGRYVRLARTVRGKALDRVVRRQLERPAPCHGSLGREERRGGEQGASSAPGQRVGQVIRTVSSPDVRLARRFHPSDATASRGPGNRTRPGHVARGKVGRVRSFLPVLCLLLGGCAARGGGPEPLDLVLEHGDVVDGTGAPRIRADVGVRGDRIVSLGDLDRRAGPASRRRLRASHHPGLHRPARAIRVLGPHRWSSRGQDPPGDHHRPPRRGRIRRPARSRRPRGVARPGAVPSPDRLADPGRLLGPPRPRPSVDPGRYPRRGQVGSRLRPRPRKHPARAGSAPADAGRGRDRNAPGRLWRRLVPSISGEQVCDHRRARRTRRGRRSPPRLLRHPPPLRGGRCPRGARRGDRHRSPCERPGRDLAPQDLGQAELGADEGRGRAHRPGAGSGPGRVGERLPVPGRRESALHRRSGMGQRRGA